MIPSALQYILGPVQVLTLRNLYISNQVKYNQVNKPHSFMSLGISIMYFIPSALEPLQISQQFSTRGNSAPPGVCLDTFLVATKGVGVTTGFLQVQARNATKHPSKDRTAHQKLRMSCSHMPIVLRLRNLALDFKDILMIL